MRIASKVLSLAVFALSATAFAEDNMHHHYYSGAHEHEKVYKFQPQNKPTARQHCNYTSQTSVYTQGPTVTTSPYLGIRSAFDGHDLIVNLPTMNEDLRLLQQRLALKHELGTLPCIHRPIVEISGDVLGQMYYREDYLDRSSHDVNLNGARFDVLGEVSEWALGYISINYDDSRLANSLPGTGYRVKNSRLFLKRGFLTIGDLDCSPVYFSVGQMFVPFGRYSSGTVSGTVTSSLAKTNARAALLGFYQSGFYASVYAFRGDSRVGDTGINQWGINAGYDIDYRCVTGHIGAGYIANIADAAGLQCPGNSEGFFGFANDNTAEVLEQRVPAYDINGKLTYGCFSAIVEYVNTTRPFNIMNLSYNNKGARLSALQLELQARRELWEYNFMLSLSYGHTCDALAVGLPEHSYIVAMSTSIWKNTIESLEYRHDSNYGEGDTAGGNGADPNPITSPGGSRNSVVGQIGVYF